MPQSAQAIILARRNLAIASLLALANILQFQLLPMIAAVWGNVWLFLLIPLALTHNSLWYAIHESFHGSLHPNRKVNDAVGRTLCTLFGSPYPVARLGHLMHHRFNRSALDRPEAWDPASRSWPAAALRYYPRLLGGLYLAQLASFILFFQPLPRVCMTMERLLQGDEAANQIRRTALDQLGKPETVREVRLEGLLCYGQLGLSVGLYAGLTGLWFVPLIVLAGRALLVSMADNLPHYGTSIERPDYAFNLALPRPVQALFLNFNHHRTHHHSPTTPWHLLPKSTAEAGDRLDRSWFTAALDQLRGPIPLQRLIHGQTTDLAH